MVGFSILPDPDAYLARTGAFFGADPVLHTLPLGVADAVRLGRYPTWVLSLVESSSGDVVAVGVQTPPYNQIVAAVDREALRTLAVGLAGSDVVLPGVTGLVPRVHEFAEEWSALKGVRAEESMAERLFRLDELVPPQPSPGAARRAVMSDADLLTDWHERFRAEAGIEPPIDSRLATERSIADGRRYVWEDGGVVVCDVGHGIPTCGQVRIGPVYTPPPYRGRGYASNLTARVTAVALEEGLVPTLFTDLANPTSNRIYQALGYRPVADAFMLRFIGEEGAAVA